MSKRERRLLLAYGLAIPLIMFGVNYGRGRDAGEPPGFAALTSLLALTIVLAILAGIFGWTVLTHRRQGPGDRVAERRPGERGRPPGWQWDDRSRRWRRPQRP